MSSLSKIELFINGPKGSLEIKFKVAQAFQQFLIQTRRFNHT